MSLLWRAWIDECLGPMSCENLKEKVWRGKAASVGRKVSDFSYLQLILCRFSNLVLTSWNLVIILLLSFPIFFESIIWICHGNLCLVALNVVVVVVVFYVLLCVLIASNVI